ncbi:MAG: TonB-dependent receptor [Novosphingobium sp.]
MHRSRRDHAAVPALLLGSAALIAPLSAQAQEASPESAEEIIVTAQRINQTDVSRAGSAGVFGDKAAEDLPFQLKSYNAALILNQQPQTLGQVLENDPSVRTTYGFGNAAEQFVIRGFTLFGDDVGIDGLYGIAPRQLIAPELYDSVQVLNGASAFVNGAAPGGSGLGGSVNLMPKRAGTKALTRVTANWTSGSHFGGSFDLSRRFGANNEWGVRINGAARAGDVSVDNEYRSAYVIGGAFDYNSGPLRVSLDLGFQRVHVRGLRHKVQIVTGQPLPAVPAADANYAQPWTYTTMRDVFGVFKVEYDVADNAMLYASFGARDGAEEGIYGGIRVDNSATGAGFGTGFYVPRTDNNEALQGGLRVKLGEKVTHEINFGGSITWQVNRNAFDFLYDAGFGPFAGFPTNLYNAVAVPIPASSFVGGRLADPLPMSRTKLWSAFASDTIGFWDDRMMITAGLRLQAVQAKTYAGLVPGDLTGTYDESAITPVVGLVVKPAEGVSLYFNRMQGFEKPDNAPATGGGLTITNSGEAFTPVKTTQYEFGGKARFGKINASLAFFQIDRPRPGVTQTSSTTGVYGLIGEQRNKGFEVSVDGEITKGLRLIAGGSVIDATIRKALNGALNGKKAVGVPEYLINANVEWDLPFIPALTLTGRIVHTGEQWVDELNTLKLPSWTRFDLGARYVTLVADKPLTLRFNVDNVVNKRYWASSFDLFPPYLLQGAPRTFKASASIDF